MSELAAALWPLDRLPDALEALAVRAGVRLRAAALPEAPRARDLPSLGRWLEAAAEGQGLEAEAADAPLPEVEAMVRGLGHSIVLVEGEGGLQAAVTLGARGERLLLLGPDHREHRAPVRALRDALCAGKESAALPEVERLLDRAALTGRPRDRTRAALLKGRLAQVRIEGAFLLRLPPSSPPRLQLQNARLPLRLSALIVLQAVDFSLWLLSWWVIGAGALQGRLDPGWLAAWALLRLTLVPLRMLETWAAGTLALDASLLLKVRLLAGALRLSPEEMRREGMGQLLGRTLEANALETLGIGPSLSALSGLTELCVSAAVMALGAGGLWQLSALFVWCAALALVLARYHKLRGEWTRARLELTHDQVERMVGHRTRLAQERRESWHEDEDHALDRYAELSRRLDRAFLPLGAGASRGFLLLALLALAPAFIGRADPAALALSVLGALFAFGALEKLSGALSALSSAALSWNQVAPIFAAAARVPAKTSPEVAAAAPAAEGDSGIVLDAHELTYRHKGRAEAVVRGANLRLQAGDRVLLQGATGSGKSTLGSLLSGLRAPDSGLLLLRGLDQHTLGADGFRKRVAAAPQFHENHVLTGTFAFNLLMGRAWPPAPADLAEATAICNELELGPLLARMPAGILQTVGETGWQLSHGEKSRLFIARALLQRADVVLLDESFAALDPLTLQAAMKCVLTRARTLIVIAHP